MEVNFVLTVPLAIISAFVSAATSEIKSISINSIDRRFLIQTSLLKIPRT
jgi:hypothetical protein